MPGFTKKASSLQIDVRACCLSQLQPHAGRLIPPPVLKPGMHDRLREILQNDPRQANDLTTGESPLGWSAYGGQTESALIVFQYGALADRPPYKENAWQPVAMVACAAVARILLHHGAKPNWRDANGDTPLHRVLKSRIVLDPTEFVKRPARCGR